MNFDINDRRLYKAQLAERFSCTTRTISNWWAKGILPAPYVDEYSRPFNYASEIAEHEARLARAWPAPNRPRRTPGRTSRNRCTTAQLVRAQTNSSETP